MELELFDRYVREVGRRLPKKQRADVQAELHSLLLDALQDRLDERGTEAAATEEDQVAILQEMGPPAKVAAQYAPPNRYLIGPRFYDMYMVVVAAVAGAITLAYLVLLVLALWGSAESFQMVATAFGEVFDSYLGAVLAGLGSVTLTFAILERVLPESEYRARTLTTYPLPAVALERISSESPFDEGDEEIWNPRMLPEIEDPERIEVGGLAVEIGFTVLALIAFNFFGEWIGFSFVGTINDGPIQLHARPMLAPIFFAAYLPLLNVSWLAQIGLDVALLRQGRWQRVTRIVDFCLSVLGAFILYLMVSGPPMLTMESIRDASLRETLSSILLPLLKLGLVIGLVAEVIEAIRKLFRIFRIAPASAWRQVVAKEPAENR